MVYQRTIFLHDTDAAGVVYFASLMSICHEAYESALNAGGVPFKSLISDATLALPVVEARIRFFHPLFCGDRVSIAPVPALINSSEFKVDFEVFLAHEAPIKVAYAMTRHVSINPSLRHRLPLPAPIIGWLDSHSVNLDNL
ncbi:MAG: 1,4-dihydroxy-2-naphthoyl-CoA hydrolase [Chroococcopsis gigantea SAG 12.99]|jgi:1,4-dihydroxy-2-naphthoyl-CoA hydrolase|nr:1,4-dihydroxy-2-naphthoyl-CoA hydrolase [Chlorogloea purpurea SAG 13.99]MDV3001278.1 1,4-dihydroxy-2-naphthoyl-CoA hydrolase [Chroococcopsis gigantea SAG 12.99]